MVTAGEFRYFINFSFLNRALALRLNRHGTFPPERSIVCATVLCPPPEVLLPIPTPRPPREASIDAPTIAVGAHLIPSCRPKMVPHFCDTPMVLSKG